MASFRIHEDIENRIPVEFAQKGSMNPAGQKKRPVLGAIDHQQFSNMCNKQNILGKPKSLKDQENLFPKLQANKLPLPVVPVAQFKAFNVYEDKQDDKENKVHKSEKILQEDVSKRIVMDIIQPKIITETPMSEGSVAESPISIDISPATNKLEEIITVTRSKSERDAFFENIEYQDVIFQYLREAELRHRPKKFYMKKQPDITYNMRTILVDWLVEVAEEYRLQTETLYLAVSYIDRFLSYMSVVRAKLQLVGTSAMFIASKFEEIYPPDVGEFVYITDDTYSKKQVLRMEQLILKVLSFDLSIPTPLTFITAICITNQLSDKTMYLAMYITELSMLEAEPYLQFLPSELASAAIAIARFLLQTDTKKLSQTEGEGREYIAKDGQLHAREEQAVWNQKLEEKTGYRLAQLNAPIRFLLKLYGSAPNLVQQAIQEKYKASKYMHVSMFKSIMNGPFPYPPEVTACNGDDLENISQ